MLDRALCVALALALAAVCICIFDPTFSATNLFRMIVR
jgi:hypothetical protein